LPGCGKFLSNFDRLPNESTTVSFKSDHPAFEAATSQLGGVMFYLINTAAGGIGMIGSFPTEDAMNAATLVIPNGVYKLYALGYAGSSPGGGQVRCGFGNSGANITLNGGNASIPIDISQPNCGFAAVIAGAPNVFSEAYGAYGATNNFNTWKIQLCNAVPTTSTCTQPSTSDLSNMQITIMAGTGGGTNSAVNENTAVELKSACIPNASGIWTFSAGSFNMPISPVFPTPVKISFFPTGDTNCTSAPLKTLQYSDGLKGLTTTGGPVLVSYATGTTTVSIYRTLW
jgi:hypothetical protein